MSQQSAMVPTRNFLLYLLLSFITFGIAMIVYFYRNFVDLNALAAKRNSSVQPLSPIVGLLLLFLGPLGIISFWLKFSHMNDIINQTGAGAEEPRVPSPLMVIILSMFTLGLYGLYATWKWQSVMNYYAVQ